MRPFFVVNVVPVLEPLRSSSVPSSKACSQRCEYVADHHNRSISKLSWNLPQPSILIWIPWDSRIKWDLEISVFIFLQDKMRKKDGGV